METMQHGAMSAIRCLRLSALLAALIAPAALHGAAPPGASPKQDQPSLAGQLLIASPEMRDPRFQQTVLVMVRHDRDGAMGIVINRPLGEQPLARLLEAIGEMAAGATGALPRCSRAGRCSSSWALSCTAPTIAGPRPARSPQASP